MSRKVDSVTARKALVTGSTKGIGRATAIALADAGLDVAIHGRNEQELQQVSEEILQKGVNCLTFKADLAKPEEAKLLAEELSEQWEGVDVLVNNAGINHSGSLYETTNDDLTRLIDTNLRSMFVLTQLLSPYMTGRNWGRIINLTSMTARLGRGFVGSVTYAASKGAIISFTRGLAKELGPSNVTVNAIAPGVIVTDMNRDFLQDHGEQVIQDIPLARFGDAYDIASVVVFLASDGASYVTGTTLDVNGGLVFG